MKTISAILFAFFATANIFGQVKPQKETVVVISTKFGDIKIKLYNETPKHRDNFIKLVKEGFYNTTLFHRVINGFMIQGGDPDSKGADPGEVLGNGGPGYTIPAEFNPKLFHKRGALAAARMGDEVNPKKESSGSQFYIVQGRKYTAVDINAIAQRMKKPFTPEQITAYTSDGGTPHLDGSYTVFGEVISGFDVIDQIVGQKTDKADRPVEDIVMNMKIVE
ncbi:MAG: peptidylprolyl isomerase [Bacteroidetes bacterium]|nr:peptidylprolyl isomerase [Bacteroidota bacterium]